MGGYRHSTFDEVAEHVYYDSDYMKKYMIGLQVSGYVWNNHRAIHEWFLDRHKMMFSGKRYLEIGPGHGQYFTEAYNLGKFREYIAVDLSQSSLDMTKRYFEDFRMREDIDPQFVLSDFLGWDDTDSFDGVCISEVLEHVENPYDVMKKIHAVLSDNGLVYVNVPINAPAIDHIYLFRNCKEVEDMFEKCGFEEVDRLIETGNGKSLEKAEKKKTAINYVSVLKKQQ